MPQLISLRMAVESQAEMRGTKADLCSGLQERKSHDFFWCIQFPIEKGSLGSLRASREVKKEEVTDLTEEAVFSELILITEAALVSVT